MCVMTTFGLHAKAGLSNMDTEGFAKVLVEYPELTANGFESDADLRRYEKRFGQPRQRCHPPSMEGVQLCVEWLLGHDALDRRKTINYKMTSYGWKHVAERAIGEYVSNGDFICAALYLKYKMKRDGTSPNVYLNIRDYKEKQ